MAGLDSPRLPVHSARPSDPRHGGLEMKFSRRHFLKAAGAGGPGAVALSTVGASVTGLVSLEDTAQAQTPPSPLSIPAPMTKETATFNVNGKPYRADYEARTTLWEVIAVKLGLTG